MTPTLLKNALGLSIAALACVLVKLIGSELGWSPQVQQVAMLGIALVWATLTGVAYLLARRGAAQIESTLRQQAADFAQSARPDKKAEIDDLRRQFESALDMLKRSRRGKTALHSLPVYVLIGPPGSGKTTMLRESSLDFPFMTGRREIRGVGGTRNCDWWFGSRGILLDTAGRFVVENDDREEWLAFLGMVRKARPRRPINGAVIGISVTDVLNASEVELRSLGEQIRERVDELVQHLQIVFPVYLVFTKCDQLAGFVEFFSRFSKDQRKQVWGFTVPFRRGASAAAAFAEEFDELYRRLATMRVDHFLSEGARRDREKRYTFPLQFALAKQRIADFLAQLEQTNPYQEAAPIRGVYFTSGTQERSKLDHLIDQISVVAEVPAEVPRDQRKCYFIDDVFEKVAFVDAELAEPTVDAARRRTWLRRAGAAAAAVVGVGLLYQGFGTWSRRVEATRAVSQLADPLGTTYDVPLGPSQVAALDGARERITNGPTDEATTALRALFHFRLRQSLVPSAAQHAAHRLEECVPVEKEDWSQRKFAEIQADLEGRVSRAEAWLLTHDFFAQASETAAGAGNVASMGPDMAAVDDIGKRLEAWRSGTKDVPVDDVRLRRLFDYFAANRQQLSLVEPRANRDDVAKVRAACLRIWAARWDEFKDLSREQQFPLTSKFLGGDGEGLVHVIDAKYEDVVRPLTIARTWSADGQDEFEGRLKKELAELTDRYAAPNTPDASAHETALKEFAAELREQYRKRARTSWLDVLKNVRPQPVIRPDQLDAWLGSEASPTITERLAAAYEERFAAPAPVTPPPEAPKKRDPPRSGLRQFREPVEQLGTTLRKLESIAAGLTAASDFTSRTDPLRKGLGLGMTTDLSEPARDAVRDLDSRGLEAIVDSLAVSLRTSVNRTWSDLHQPVLERVSKRFPFAADAAQDVSDADFLLPFTQVEPVLVAVTGFATRRDLDMWQRRLALAEPVVGLRDKLAKLHQTLLVNDLLDATFKASFQRGLAFDFRALGQTINEDAAAGVAFEFQWKANPKHLATINILVGRDQRPAVPLGLRQLKERPQKVDEFPGTWGLLRLVRLRQTGGDASAGSGTGPRKARWEFVDRDAFGKLEIEFEPSPVTDILFDETAFTLPPVTELFVAK